MRPLTPFPLPPCGRRLKWVYLRGLLAQSLFQFKVGPSNLEVFHLQYADDILILVESSVDFLQTIKTILRGFELPSGLKVNFPKSILIGVNVDPSFLQHVEDFLHYKIESLLFQCLGFLVEAKPLLESTWEPLLNRCEKKIIIDLICMFAYGVR